MKTITIKATQERINRSANGEDVAIYYIIKGADDLAYIVPQADADEYTADYGFEKVAQVNLHRPEYLWGNREEVEGEIKRIIAEEAIAEEICEENEAGTLFVK